jgi:hypothetical protein
LCADKHNGLQLAKYNNHPFVQVILSNPIHFNSNPFNSNPSQQPSIRTSTSTTNHPFICACAGKRNLGDVTHEVLSTAVADNSRWLEECVMLLLCVLSLDRFADYGSDQVRVRVCVLPWLLRRIV